MKIYFLHFLFISLLILLSIWIILDPSYLDSFSLKNIHNDFCQRTTKKTKIDQLTCKNNLTKKKFIWILLDGLAFDQITYLREKYSKKAAIYKVTADFFRQSGSLHEIYITGKFSRNFLAEKTLTDNLLWQMNNSNFDLRYIGSEYPMYYLGGGKELNKELNYFSNNYIARDSFPFSILCPDMNFIFYPIFFKFDIPEEFNSLNFDKKEFMKYLDSHYEQNLLDFRVDQCIQRGKNGINNIIHYTQIIDSFNHGYSKEHPRAFAASYAINKAMESIIKWIDNNKDYALILSSDHGGQAYLGEDNYCNHGCLRPGNEGVLFIYISEFIDKIKVKYEEKLINTFDVADIITQFLENANFPLESNGKLIDIVENIENKIIALRKHEIQLKVLMDKYPLKNNIDNKYSDLYNSDFYNQLKNLNSYSEIQSISNINKFIENYNEYNQELKLQIKNLEKSISNKIYLFLIGSIILIPLFVFINFSALEFFGFRESSSRLYHLKYIILLLIFYSDSFSAFFITNDLNFETLYRFSHYFSFILMIFLIILPLDKNDKDINITFQLVEKEGFELVNSKGSVSRSNIDEEKNEIFNDDQSTKINKNNKIKVLHLFLIILISICFVFIHFNIFAELKKIGSRMDNPKLIDWFNYPIFIVLIFSLLRKNNLEILQGENLSKKIINNFILLWYGIIIIFMIVFDQRHPKYFTKQDETQQNLTKTIYIMLTLHILYSFSNPGSSKNHYQYLRTLKIPLLMFLFFICDEFERILLIFVYFLSLQIFCYFAKFFNKRFLNFFLIVLIIKFSHIYFTFMKGTFTFDISLKAGNKTIGSYQDETPLFTGFLFGLHKMQVFLICSVMVLNLLEIEVDERNNSFSLSN